MGAPNQGEEYITRARLTPCHPERRSEPRLRGEDKSRDLLVGRSRKATMTLELRHLECISDPRQILRFAQDDADKDLSRELSAES